ncbi:FG-GAP-like repeat-containing protein [Reichenbachiella carrageenanivorans]|uniref:FG-GAP-like repeat-containing protein n=1 Tax=Reichenbachiella carrageenanivorans TaxID=2979869 RepID=A0ABY6D1B1_9BACT|nr:FG-GAP-like repeat-containing protein [Reichenbachiella carrageenanivorans]UXX79960.1 FG-GAP-like repeat-containing protein [Reichenbachiella carrageenanivorans]
MTTSNRSLLLFTLLFIPFSFCFGQAPTITSFSPTSGPVGTAVTITGTNFSTTASDNIVYFGAVRAVASAVSSTTLTVHVPDYACSVNPVRVTNLATNLSADSWTSSTPRFRVTYSGGTISASSFDLTEFTSISAYAFDVADFNNDGALDIVVGSNSGNEFLIYYNDLAGGFQTPTTFTGPNGIFDIVAVDVNNDGHIDLGISYSSSLSIQINDGVGGFNDGSTFTLSAGGAIRCFTFGDINEDGNWDIISGMTSRDAVWAAGDGSGGFTYNQVSTRTTESVMGIDIADMDKDGHADIIGANFTSSAAESNLNNGAGNFTRTALDVGFQPSAVAIGDFNNDGNFDIAASPPNTTNNIGIILGNGDGTYQTYSTRAVGFEPNGIIAGDLNGDGNDDLIAIQRTANPQILMGSGSNTFTQINIAGGEGVGQSSKPKIADFNGDGKPDFVTSIYLATKLQIFIQKAIKPIVQASALTFSNIGSSQMDVNWANGNGTKRIVVASTSAISWTPTDGTSYPANSTFGTGANLGSNTFVVYNGAANGFTVDGLTQATNYHFRVFEYEGGISSELYYTPTATGNPRSQKSYSPFITTWSTTDGSITIPTINTETYNYDIYWENEGDPSDFGSLSNQTGNAVISGLVSGDTYQARNLRRFSKNPFRQRNGQ